MKGENQDSGNDGKEGFRISVIIPTYNEEAYLGETLDSILNQSLKPDEILIVDYNSKDKTREIARKRGVRIVEINERGISNARHMGAIEAKGDVIIHTSADIRAHKDWIKNLTLPLKKKEADMTYGSVYLKDPDFVESFFASLLNNYITPLLSKVGFVFGTADNIACFRDFYFDVGGFNTKLVTGEDTDLIKRAMRKGRVVYVRDAIVFTDSRRIRKWGKLKYFLFHFKNFLQYNLFGKAEKEYEPVR